MQRPYSQDAYIHGGEEVEQYYSPPTLDEAIKRSQDFLLSQQYPEGFWCGEVEANATITSHTVVLYKILGIEDRYPMHKFEKHLRRTQQSHGGWELFYGDGGYLSATIESYIALRLLNVSQSDPALKKARKFIINHGGVMKARLFTKICLALLGCFDWRCIPSLPPWVMLLPSWTKANIYETAAWARGCIVPLIVILDKKPVFRVSPEVSFDELYAEGRELACQSLPFSGTWMSDFFVAVDRVFKTMERWGVVPFRQWGLREAEKWLLERQEETGDFMGMHVPMFYSVVCMATLYKVADPVVQRALLPFRSFSIETPEECWVQSTSSPVWDTAFIVRSLVESGIPADHPALQKAGEWLLEKQITKHGDWSVKNRRGHVLAGGWAFQFVNRWYPDIDDSAAVVMALMCIKLPREDVKHAAIARCIEWISSMQSQGGSWAAYDKVDNHQHWINSVPFSDLKATLDTNSVDISARVLEMAGQSKLLGSRFNYHADADLQLPPHTITRGLAYLRREQESEGCWYGTWGVNYIYGTCGALLALSLLAPTTHAKEIARGAQWLVQVQNVKKKGPGDGGWGETCFSYTDSALKGCSDASTASQTAWALQGLLAAGDALGQYEMESIEQGVQYLLSTQRRDGSWHEAQFTGACFPNHFYVRYHFYAQHFTLSSLARYRTRLQASKIKSPTL